MRIVAVLCVRNELQYLKYLFPYLEKEGVDVVLIDNDSTDGTVDFCRSSDISNVIEIVRLPFEGEFDLTAQLNLKREVFSQVEADWLIHQDADEFLQSGNRWGGLRASIEKAENEGFNALNFEELVMLPVDALSDDFLNNNRSYYYFSPKPQRLMRAWKNIGLDSSATGGHVLRGSDLKMAPYQMILKHFIVRSQQHAYSKYLGRTFSNQDLQKRWHGNRLSFTKENLTIPVSSPHLHKLLDPKDTPDELPEPVSRHYWQWGY